MTPPAPITTVSGTPPAAAPPAQTPPAAPPPAETVPKAEYDAAVARAAEMERVATFWHGKAKEAPAPAQPAQPETPKVDMLDLLATKGEAGLDEYLKNKGFVRAEDVDARVNQKVTEVQAQQQLVTRFPDLKDEKSDFFKATALAYGELKKQGVGDVLAMQMAAQQTALEFIEEGKTMTPAQKKAAATADRQARAAAQGGDKGIRTPAEAGEDDELTPEEKLICSKMGVSEEAYKARAKKGVSIGGLGNKR